MANAWDSCPGVPLGLIRAKGKEGDSVLLIKEFKSQYIASAFAVFPFPASVCLASGLSERPCGCAMQVSPNWGILRGALPNLR